MVVISSNYASVESEFLNKFDSFFLHHLWFNSLSLFLCEDTSLYVYIQELL